MMSAWLLSCVLVCLGLWWWARGRGRGRAPGPWGLPLLGYLPWMDPRRPYRTLTSLAARYGPVYSLQLGGVTTFVLADHRVIRKVLSQEVFAARADLYLTHGIMQGYGVIVAEGERWREQRKFSLTSLRTLGMVKVGARRGLMEARILRALQQTVRILEDRKEGLDPAKTLMHVMGNVMNGILFGKEWAIDDPTWLWLQELCEKGIKLIGVAGPLNFLPCLRWLPYYRKTLAYLLEGKEATHKVYKSTLEEAGGDDCVGGMFLKEMADGRGNHFTETQMYHLLADLWGAGVDTTLTTIRWYLLYMALLTPIQAKVQEEVDGLLGERAWPALDDLPSLPYTEATIAEAQRIRSAVPLGLPHAGVRDTLIEGYRVPKGAMIVPLQWAVHTDPRHWPRPDVFDPSRFLDSQGKFYRPEAFMPFQTGKRSCVGEEMAHMVLFIFCAGLLRHFRLSPVGDVTSALEGECGFTLVPGHHEILFTKRDLVLAEKNN